jgi:hypothetical protein
MQTWIKLVPLVLAGSLCLIGCAAKTGPEAGDGCRHEGQESECASVGPDPCGPCGGHWLHCQGGRWIPIHCEPIRPPAVDPGPDAAVDVRDAAQAPPIADGGGLIDAAALTRTITPRMAPEPCRPSGFVANQCLALCPPSASVPSARPQPQ